MAGLRHPNIILFMGSCFDKVNQEFLLVMEYMVRGSLYDVLYNKSISLSMDLQLHLAYQISQGINFLHQSSPPIIHCDIKSHNVLLDEKWNCRICDFGITIFNTTNKKSGEDEALGTVYWSSPEVLNGGNHTMQSDCYALGILLWEIFHRELPFSGRDPLSVAMDVVNGGSRPIMGMHISPQLSQLISSCWDQDPSKRPSVQDVVHNLRDLALSKPSYNHSPDDSSIAPSGTVAFVSTDILEGPELWEAVPSLMPQVMKQHNALVRSLLQTYKGYEVSFKNHSFLFAFAKTSDAINFCCSAQNTLLRSSWPSPLLNLPSAKREEVDDELVWNGPRVAMVIHKGIPQCIQDKITQKMFYDGPVLKKIDSLKRKAVGGVILITKSTLASGDAGNLDYELCEESNESGEEATSFIVPKFLEERMRNAITRVIMYDADESPHTVIDMNETPSMELKKKKKEKGIIQYEKLTLEKKIGLGSGAEVHSAVYKGQDVAAKLLINQNFSEENSFTLRYIAATLTNISHPNILNFYGICLEPPHICIVTELMHTSLAKFYASSAAISHSERIRIAKGVANGMNFLCHCEDSTLGTNLRLNSNNILLGKNGEVKIADFAVNKLYDSNRTLTSVNAVAWTAPELLGSEEEVSPAVSVYSFGIILWETRKKPYALVHPIRLLTMVAKGHRPEIPNDCPIIYANLMRTCWASDPQERPGWDEIISSLNSM